MGRAKGKERKEHKRPFVAKVKVSEDIVGDNFTHINVTVTLETKVGEMKRRIAAAEPTLRAERILIFSTKTSLDDDEETLADCELNKDSLFVLFTLELLTVQTLERSFTLLVTTNGTTQYIKCTIENRHPDLPAAKMVLVHNGAVLRNDDKLSEKGIAEGSVVGCLVRRPEQAQREARRFWKMARRLCDFCGKQGRISKPTFPRCSLQQTSLLRRELSARRLGGRASRFLCGTNRGVRTFGCPEEGGTLRGAWRPRRGLRPVRTLATSYPGNEFGPRARPGPRRSPRPVRTLVSMCIVYYATRSRSSPSKSFGHVSPRRSRPVDVSVGVVFTPAPTAAALDFITSSKPLAVSL